MLAAPERSSQMKIVFRKPPELGVLYEGLYVLTDGGRAFGPYTIAQATAHREEFKRRSQPDGQPLPPAVDQAAEPAEPSFSP
jgi:hypothetical protein